MQNMSLRKQFFELNSKINFKLDIDPNTSRMTSPTNRNYEMDMEQFIYSRKRSSSSFKIVIQAIFTNI